MKIFTVITVIAIIFGANQTNCLNEANSDSTGIMEEDEVSLTPKNFNCGH